MKKILNYYEKNQTGFFSKKTIRVMKITPFLLILTVLQLWASETYSQLTKLTLNAKDASISEVLRDIEDQSEFFFLYSPKQIDVERKISIDVNEETIKDILFDIFSSDVKFIVSDRQIILTPSEQIADLGELLQQQKRIISGTVTEKDGTPLPGVNVAVSGTTTGAITDGTGGYKIEIPEGANSLKFSFIGMEPQEIPIGNQTQINVTMIETSVGLEEVVVVGYGTAKKATVSGSISSVKGEDLTVSPSINVTSNLVGRLSGVVSLTSSGEPGDDSPTILIRGSNTLNDNSPLIVVDGIANRSMDQLDPADIESITVLKDASAAIYGAQAANGVILVTTKRGSVGKPEIKVSFNQALNQPTRLPEMADAATYATMLNEIAYYAGNGQNNIYSDAEIEKFRTGSDPWHYCNTDWYDATIKKFSQQRYGNISVSGGTDKMKYFVALGTKYQDGIYKNSATYYKQYNFRSNLDGKVTKDIEFGIDISGRQEERNYSAVSEDNIFWMVVRGKPTYPAYWPDGTPGPDIEYGYNPVVICTDATGYDNNKTYVFESNARLKANIPWIKGLSLTGNLAIDKTFENDKYFIKPWYLYTWDGTSYDTDGNPALVKGTRGVDDPQLTQDMGDNQSITANFLVNYSTTLFGSHNLSVLAGVERNQGTSMSFEAFRRYFVSEAIDQLFAGGDSEKDNAGSASQSARLNYFGRINYNIKEKYLAEFLWRYDGSYIFPENSRYGFFPGISLAYRISEEDFWNDRIFQSFKIRGSWGQTGNDRVDPYQYLAKYAYATSSGPWGSSALTYVFNGTDLVKMLDEDVVPNSEITWEVANQSNIGFNATALNDKLSIEFDYFYNLRTKILIEREASLPGTTGISPPSENIGKVSNQGFELSIGYNDKISDDLFYSISLTTGYQYNKILFWDETPGSPEWQVSTGHPMNTSLYYKSLGIFQTEDDLAYPHWEGARTGDIIFEDVDGSGTITADDRVRMDKNSTPRFTGGININLRYRNFDLTILAQGAAGAVAYISGIDYSGEVGNFYQEFAANRWTETNTNASYPRTWNRTNEYWMSNDNTFFLRSTDYIRLKNLEIGYNLPKKITNILNITGLRIAVSGANLLTIDKYKLFDPETSGYRAYPLNKTINGGITLTF